ncbi:hypothetical protein [Bradyrhizobium sp. STM 3562]|uniref:hypothetical protein n=1 Tax=Bradyrhizobium sp. STM 3562 TaxID=578924 RepID=UPI00388F8E3F
MTTLYNLDVGGCWQSLQTRLGCLAFERLVALNVASGDLRLAVIGLLSAALSRAANAWVENIARRALQGARFAKSVTAADTMVAAGRR